MMPIFLLPRKEIFMIYQTKIIYQEPSKPEQEYQIDIDLPELNNKEKDLQLKGIDNALNILDPQTQILKLNGAPYQVSLSNFRKLLKQGDDYLTSIIFSNDKKQAAPVIDESPNTVKSVQGINLTKENYSQYQEATDLMVEAIQGNVLEKPIKLNYLKEFLPAILDYPCYILPKTGRLTNKALKLLKAKTGFEWDRNNTVKSGSIIENGGIAWTVVTLQEKHEETVKLEKPEQQPTYVTLDEPVAGIGIDQKGTADALVTTEDELNKTDGPAYPFDTTDVNGNQRENDLKALTKEVSRLSQLVTSLTKFTNFDEELNINHIDIPTAILSDLQKIQSNKELASYLFNFVTMVGSGTNDSLAKYRKPDMFLKVVEAIASYRQNEA